jgi:hypothetical protein
MEMPTPPFTVRLPDKEREMLRTMARIYGSPNCSVFLRELIAAMLSGDEKLAGAFYSRLVERVTGQIALDLQFEAKKKADHFALIGAKRARDAKKAICSSVSKNSKMRRVRHG